MDSFIGEKSTMPKKEANKQVLYAVVISKQAAW